MEEPRNKTGPFFFIKFSHGDKTNFYIAFKSSGYLPYLTVHSEPRRDTVPAPVQWTQRWAKFV